MMLLIRLWSPAADRAWNGWAIAICGRSLDGRRLLIALPIDRIG